MRLFSSSPAFVAAGALVWGCAVYDSGLVPTDDSLISNGGNSPSTSGKGSTNESGSSTADAGKTTTTPGGKSSTGEAGTATAGTSMSAEAGDGGEAPTGTGGTSGGNGGAGGSKAGAGGTAGTTGGGGKGGTGGTAGTNGGGSGGSAPVAKCADHPITLETTWTPTASIFSPGNGMESDGLYNPPSHMTDGNSGERWSTGAPQAGGEWIQIDFGAPVSITQLTLQVSGGDAKDYPRAYAVRLSDTSAGALTAAVRASGAGVSGSTVISWPAPITGQFLSVTQTGMDVLPDTSWWTIAEVLVSCTDP